MGNPRANAGAATKARMMICTTRPGACRVTSPPELAAGGRDRHAISERRTAANAAALPAQISAFLAKVSQDVVLFQVTAREVGCEPGLFRRRELGIYPHDQLDAEQPADAKHVRRVGSMEALSLTTLSRIMPITCSQLSRPNMTPPTGRKAKAMRR
jgi:hypothetical protein